MVDMDFDKFVEKMMNDELPSDFVKQWVENQVDNLDKNIDKEWESAKDIRKAFLGLLVHDIPETIFKIANSRGKEDERRELFKHLLVLYQLKKEVERDL